MAASKTLDTNLVIYALKDLDDPNSGALWSIPRTVYTDKKYSMKDADSALPRYLLSQGTVVADMPNDETGIGGFCYLLNIPALRPPASGVHAKPKLTAKELNVAIKKLSTHAKKASK